MKDCFVLTGLSAKETKDGDTVISFKLTTEVGPGFMPTMYYSLQPLNNQQVIAKIEIVQSTINPETGEVS